MIDRRTALAGVLTMFGTAIFAPIARAATGAAIPVITMVETGPSGGGVFTAEQRALVSALSERVLPATDTPGAIAAGVPAYIEKLLADWALPEDRKPILAGLDVIEQRSRRDYKVAAAKATGAQQDALLTLAMEDKVPNGAAFFEAFRQLVITGYFTSEIGIMQEREYLPVPGQYDGAYPYSKVNKVYSS